MSERKLYNGNFVSLKDSDTVAEAIRRMLDSRVSDLPVVHADGRLAGLFRLDRLYAELLPRAAQLSYGMPDLSFVRDSLDDLAGKLREFSDRPVRDFVVPAEHVVKPGVSLLEVVGWYAVPMRLDLSKFRPATTEGQFENQGVAMMNRFLRGGPAPVRRGSGVTAPQVSGRLEPARLPTQRLEPSCQQMFSV